MPGKNESMIRLRDRYVEVVVEMTVHSSYLDAVVCIVCMYMYNTYGVCSLIPGREKRIGDRLTGFLPVEKTERTF